MHWLDPWLAVVELVAWGAHVVVPWGLAGGPEEGRRRWRLAALLLLAAGLLAFALQVALHPDRAVAAGLVELPLGGPLARGLTLTVGLLAAADAVVVMAGPRLEVAGWRLAALLALPALAAVVWTAELLRISAGPSVRPGLAVAAAVCRGAVALGAGEALLPRRPRAAPLALPALVAYFLLLPSSLAGLLRQQGDLLTLAAAALLMGSARWLPVRLRRPALAAGALLAGLLFARAAALPDALPVVVAP